MLYRLLLILLLGNFLFSNNTYSIPSVHFGAAPTWVIPVNANNELPDFRDVNDGYYIKLFEEEINIEKSEIYKHVIKDIISDAGVQGASSISVDFNPSFEQLTFHQVIVWRDGKLVDKLKKGAFKVLANEEDLSRYIYNGTYAAYLILEDIRKGDKIEYSYTITGTNPIFNRKFFANFAFQNTDPVSHIHYCILSPESRTIFFKYFNNAERPTVTKNNSSVKYEWNLLNIKGRESPHKSPNWFNPFPHVQISEYKNWKEIIDWAYKINTPDNKLNGTLGKLIGQLKDKYKDDSASLLRAIILLVQNEIRYMGVEMGVNSHKANNPEKVYKQRYGDCKDKSLLLTSILRSAGIDAEMALVNSELKEKIVEHLPSPSAFNHAIVVAHLFNKDIWVDPTIPYQGGTGIDFYCSDYGKALVLIPGSDSLKSMPISPCGTINYTEEYEVKDAHNPILMTVVTTYSLSMADDLRSNLADQSKHDLEKNYLNYYSKTYPHIKSEDSLTIIDDKKTNTIKTIERYSINDFFEFDSANQNYSAYLYADIIRDELPNLATNIVYPLSVKYPYSINCSIHINAPINWQIAKKKDTIRRNAYYFSREVSADTSKLSIEYKFTYIKDNIAADEIPQYKIDKKKMVEDYLSYSFTYTPTIGKMHKDFNQLAIMIFILLICCCTFVAMRIYKIETPQYTQTILSPKALGGWLILPLIGLIFTAGRSIYFLVNSGFFYYSIWHVYDYKVVEIQFKSMLWAEFITNSVVFCYAIFCLILMFNKRDILPKCIIIFYLCVFFLVSIDSILSHILLNTVAVDYKNIFRTFFALCIWVPYFSKAVRVKDTFIIPYPHSRYEPRQTTKTINNNIIARTKDDEFSTGENIHS